MADQDRPSKRLKIDSDPTHPISSLERGLTTAYVVGESPSAKSGSDIQNGPTRTASSKYQRKGHKTSGISVKGPPRKDSIRTFSQPLVLCVGDKGIFVTSDKGCEKKALLELQSILQDHLESRGIDARGEPMTSKAVEEMSPLDKHGSTELTTPAGIEADIASELAELKNGGQATTSATQSNTAKPMQLITLDMPCVSFVRFPPNSSLDSVEIVHTICSEAADPQAPQRSRFVKRLTPVSSLAKTLKQGLEKVCEDILPVYFGPDLAGNISSVKFAIRPTIRENEQLDRDSIIEHVAHRVQELGEKAHKVDLKGYEKGVIVEVYRGWVGISVVDNTGTGDHKQGYEQLKRFNLAEVYAKR